MSNFYKGKSGVNVKRLVQNIADQYPFKPQIAAIIELVANSLDAKASLIEITLDKIEGTLSIKDNGIGMDKGQFREYHDFAASSKTRGKSIGFAGQGAKLALNFCKKVLTETWSSNYRGYSEWWLEGNEAPYIIVDRELLTLDNLGTKVTLYLNKESMEFYTEERIKEIIYEHYLPLIDPKLKERYKNIYEEGMEILLNGKEIILDTSIEDEIELKEEIFINKRYKTVGIFGKVKTTNVFPSGVMVCTYGKVIERTFFKKEPKEKERIIGWIEAPYLIEAVTTDKCRFQVGNKIWEGFFRKAQKEFSTWLDKSGLLERPRRRELEYSDLEREINSILKNFAEFFFFGNKISKDVAILDKEGEKKLMGEGIQKVPGTIGGQTSGSGVPVSPGPEPGEGPTISPGEDISAINKPRIVRGGIRITEDERPDLLMEAWFDGETVTLNKSHPAYEKAKNNGLLYYHLLKCVIMELIKFSLEKDPDPSYIKVFELQEKFFRLWGTQ
ncbi:MAG: ATP-binding protein [Candidatus Omnitrophica bacterium]|nr:ATP-binding protein [Candidatus Omnitrophota bacterium]